MFFVKKRSICFRDFSFACSIMVRHPDGQVGVSHACAHVVSSCQTKFKAMIVKRPASEIS
jgi:hypothetical protein